MKPIYLIRNACPICSGDLKGNDQVRYLCKKCNLLFDRKHFKIEQDTKEQPLENKQTKQEKKQTSKHTPQPNKEEQPKTKNQNEEVKKHVSEEETTPLDEHPLEVPGYELEDESVLVASDKSDKMHHGKCHFLKKIHKENRVYLESIDEGKEKGYKLCVCLRRKGFK
ncbi:hypothetical protein D6774_03485 [Candidatus Woesearchaeota archaeon]|nr:MAG: hypothetical protein D6774_03485 [Candidatus Woesearchaeota archaeon]